MASNARRYFCLLLLISFFSLAYTLPINHQGHALSDFDYYRFRSNVDKAIESVKTVLDTTRNPQLAENEPHLYQDKFALAEFVTNTAIASYLIALEPLGLSKKPTLEKLLEWNHQERSPVTLRFQASITCTYVGEEEVKVVVAEHEVEQSGAYFGSSTQSTKVKKTVKEYSWDMNLSYNITAFSGSNLNSSITLDRGETSRTIITPSKTSPLDMQRKAVGLTSDVPLTWLLQNLSPKDGVSSFSIDRLHQRCKTPRRNVDIDEALEFDRKIYNWASKVYLFLDRNVDWTILKMHKPVQGEVVEEPSLNTFISASDNKIFVPIMPLMDNSTILHKDLYSLLGEQARSIKEVMDKVSKVYQKNQKESLITAKEASMAALVGHTMRLSQEHADAVEYVEHMLYSQLLKAIGKHVHPQDFDDFMRTHYKSFLGPQFVFEPFARSIRQPDRYPDGILSIENPGHSNQNVMTVVRHVPGAANYPIKLPINAATTLELSGDRYLHGWMQHWFRKSTNSEHSFLLAARARQFSSFLLVVGTMAGPDEFTPKNAIILRNKDEILIPLLAEVLPSAKAFRDAIESLSPEQQAFAKAFRAMQLQSSVFGVSVIQLKPQLERLLNLPPGALTKEIELTENLMSLFVEYQIPSDLLSFDYQDENATMAVKLEAVKGHVANVMKVIESKKKQQLEEQRLKTDMRAEQSFAPPLESWQPLAMPFEERGRARRLLSAHASTAGAELPGLQVGLSMPDANDDGFESQYEEFENPAEKLQEESIKDDVSDQVLNKVDFTLIPKQLDVKLEQYDLDGSLRSVILRAADSWSLKSQETLLSPIKSKHLTREAIEHEKKKAFDLLDAISRSGTLPITSSELHVFIAVSHCFEKSIVETVLQDNTNPIEKVEKSMLLLGSTIYGVSANALISHNKKTLDRMTAASPELFLTSDSTSTT